MIRLRPRPPRTALAFVAVAVFACATDTAIGPDSITSLTVVPDTLSLPVGATHQLKAVARDSKGIPYVGVDAVWSSSSDLVATVSATGRVSGAALGTATITATAGGFTATAQIVTVPPPAITLSAATAGFNAIANGPDPTQQVIAITNGGGASLTGITVDTIIYVAPASGWLSATLDQTTAPATLTLGAASAGLAVGPHTAKVVIASPVAINSPESVTVTFTVTVGAPTQVDLNAGDGQTATVNTAVTTKPSVIVHDQYGNPVTGVSVNFTVTGGGGILTGASPTTDASGIATVGSWTLGTALGPNSLSADAPGLTGSPVTFTATGIAGAASQIAVSTGDAQTATVGSLLPVPPTVLVRDQFNNPVQGVTVTFAVASGGGNATGATPVTDAAGLAAVGGWTLGTAAVVNTLTATAPGLTGSPLTFSATATPAPASQIAAMVGDGQSVAVNTAVPVAPTVIVRDQFSNPVAGVEVTFAVASGGGNLSAGVDTTDAAGIAAVGSWTVGTTTGTNTLAATAPGLAGSPVTFTATATASAATQVSLSAGNGQTVTANTAVTVAPAVLVRDQFNNPVPGVSVTFAVTGGGGTITGANTTTDPSGIATVGSWTLGTGAGANTLTATAPGLTGSPVTFTATGTADVATQIALNTGNGQTATVNTAVAIAPSVVVRDQYGNPVQNVSVSFAVQSGGGALTGANPTTNASGIATVGSWTVGTGAGANNNTLTATAGGLSGSPVAFTASATAAAATQIALNAGDGQTAAVTTAVPIAPSVLVRDQFNNPVANVAVMFAVTAGGGGVTGASPTTDVSGIAQVGSWTLGPSTGLNSLTATAIGLAGSPVSFTATATATAATQIALNAGNNQTATVNTTVAVNSSVVVRDQFGNPVPGVSVTFAATGGGGSVTGANATTDAAGQAAVGSWTLGQIAGPNTLTATATGLTGSPVGFSATGIAGSATQIALSAGNNQTATVNTAVAVNPSVIVQDQFGNTVSNVAVTFAVTGGGGSLTGGGPTTNASGVATVGSWTLGTTVGPNTLTATAVGLAGSPVGFTASGMAGAATQVAVSAGNNQTAAVNSAVSVAPAVVVRDAFNNPVQNVAVTFAVAAGGGAVSAGGATTNPSGIASPTSWTLGQTAGSNTLTATAPGLLGSPVTFTATATAGGATQIAVNAGNGQSATVNTAVAVNPSVLVRDQFNNPVQSVAVTFTVTGGGGGITGGSATTNASGIATLGSWTLGQTAGANSLDATSTGLTGSPVTFNATGAADAAAQISLNGGNGQSATVNTAVAVNPSVLIRDQFNNPVQSAAVSFAVTGGGGGVTGGSATTNASGIASVTSWTLGQTAGANSLEATSTGLAGSPVTFSATGTAGAATQIALNAGNGQSTTVNTAVAVSPSVLVRDQFNNPVPGVGVTFSVTGGGGGITGGNATTGTNGIAAVGSWTLGQIAGPNALGATSTGLTGSPVTFSATGTAGAATQISVNAGDNQSAQVSTAVPVAPSAFAADQFGNAVAGVSVTFAVGSGGGVVDPTTAILTDAGGVAQANSWTLGGSAGANTLTATSSPALGGSPVTFTATAFAGSATQMALDAGDGQTDTVGATLGIAYSVLVLDGSSNPVVGIPVSWAVPGGQGQISPSTSITDAFGIATATRTLGHTAGAQTATASVGGLTGSPVTFTATATAGAAAQIAMSAGNNQTATVNTAVATAPAVLVRDQFGNPVGGIAVTFAVGLGGGGVSGGSASTNPSGIATVGSWTLGTAAGTNNNTLTATSSGLTGSPVTFTASAAPGTPATLAVSAGNGQSATVNTALPIDPAVLVTDQFGNPVPSASVSVAVTGGGGSVVGSPATSDGSGIATISSWTLGTAAGANTLQATLAALTPVNFTATGTADAAAAIAVNAGNSQTATVNTAVAIAPSVRVTDQYGNPVALTSVTFTVTGGGGSINPAAPATLQTNGAGVAALTSWTLGTAAGSSNNTLSAAATGLSGSPVSFTASAAAGTATQMALNAGDGQAANVNTALPVAPAVLVRDQFNNPVPGHTVTFTVTGGVGTLVPASPASVPSDANGIAAVTSWTMGPSAGANTLTASSTGLAGSPITFTATATPATPSQIAAYAGDGQTATVNTAVAIAPAVIVRDQFNNPVGGVAVTFAVILGGGGVTGENAVTDPSGIATLGSWTIGTAAGTNNNTLTATSGSLTGSPVTLTASATAGAAQTIALNAGAGQTATVNTAVAVDPSVLVTDQFGNPVSGVLVTFAVQAGGGTVDPITAVPTDASGTATANSWTLGTIAGTNNNSLTASAAVPAGSPVTFTASATADAAAQIAANAGNSQTTTVNTNVATPPSVLVTDQFGNPVGSVGVTFAVGLGGGSRTGGNATTSPSGIATVGSWTLGTTAGTSNNTLTATSGGLAGSPVTFTASATPGAPATLAINAGDGQSATVNTTVGITPAVLVTDQFGNPVPSASVTFTVTGGGGSITGSPATTDVGGVATVTSWKLGTAAGTNSLQATYLALTPVTFTATGIADAAATIALNGGNGQSATVNTAVSTAPSVIVTDQYGNPVSSASVTFAVSGGGSVNPVTPILTNGSGIAQVTSWTLGTTAGSNTLTATSSPALTGSPVTFTATGTADVASQVALNAGNGQSDTVNTALTVAPSVLVRDQYNNPKSAVAITFTVTGGGGSISPISPATVFTDVNGIAALTSWTLGTTAGTNNNTVSATNASLSGSPVLFAATAVPGPVSASQSTVADGFATITACSISCTVAGVTADSITVTVKDQFGNGISGKSVTVSATGTNNTLAPAATGTSNASGVFAVRLSSTTAQAKSISAVANAVSITQTAAVTVTPATASLTVSSLAAGTASITACSAGCVAGSTASTITATIRDAFSNLITGAIVTFSSTGTANTFTASAVDTTTASGVAARNFNSTTAQGKTISAAVTAVGTLTTTVGVTVTYAAPSTVTVANQGFSAQVGTGVATRPTYTVRDAFSNLVTSFAVTISSTGGGTPSPTSTSTNASGQVTLTSWTMGGTAADDASGRMANTATLTAGSATGTATDYGIYTWTGNVNGVIGSTSTCEGCHAWRRSPNNIVSVAGTGSCAAFTRVVATSSSLSMLYNKLTGIPCGSSQMPPGGPFYTAAQLKIVRAWINNGALNN